MESYSAIQNFGQVIEGLQSPILRFVKLLYRPTKLLKLPIEKLRLPPCETTCLNTYVKDSPNKQ